MSAATDVTAEARRPVVVGVDVGGTKVMAGVVDRNGVVSDVVHLATPGRTCAVEVLEDVISAAVQSAAAGRPMAAVGVSAAGFVNAPGDRIAFAPHLPWRDDPVGPRLSARWGVPVALENDATCALEAEALHGAARGRASAVMVTIGTGIGGGVLTHGRVFRGAGGMAGEYGHMTVVPDGLPCECGGTGCWEQYCSGRALVRAARLGLAERVGGRQGPEAGQGQGMSQLDDLCAGDPEQVTGQMVTRAAEAGDLVALAACTQVGRWLGAGLVNLVAALDPEVVVVGGGVSAAGELLLGPARAELRERLVGASHRTIPQVVVAGTGAAAGLVGAAVLARRLAT